MSQGRTAGAFISLRLETGSQNAQGQAMYSQVLVSVGAIAFIHELDRGRCEIELINGSILKPANWISEIEFMIEERTAFSVGRYNYRTEAEVLQAYRETKLGWKPREREDIQTTTAIVRPGTERDTSPTDADRVGAPSTCVDCDKALEDGSQPLWHGGEGPLCNDDYFDRKDHKFLLNSVIPRPGQAGANYDFVLAIQPWRARMDAHFKVKFVLAPLVRSLGPGGRLLAEQSFGRDPGLEIIREIWPGEDPFKVDRHELLKVLKDMLGHEARNYNFNAYSDAKAIFQYQMHTLPDEIAESIGTSTLFAAWNAAIYVAQIEDQRLEVVLDSREYLEATARILHKHNGLWFNGESFVVSRRGNHA